MNKKKNIKDSYVPYNFSNTKCFVVTLAVTPTGICKLESKLPLQAKVLKGVYATTNAIAEELLIGTVNLWFNEGIFKSVSIPVMNTRILKHNSHPMPLKEEMEPNSTMQGIYFNRTTALAFPYLVRIYVHYEESL